MLLSLLFSHSFKFVMGMLLLFVKIEICLLESLHYGAARERSMICMVASLKNHYVIRLKNNILRHCVCLTENIKKVTADLKRS